MSSFQELLRKLEKGELPEELDFRPKENPELDWSKIQYNTFYKSDEYILERYPNSMAFGNLPASEKLLDAIKSKLTTPLEEMEERQAKILTNVRSLDTPEAYPTSNDDFLSSYRVTEYEDETETNAV
jgi:hypothetical protein